MEHVQLGQLQLGLTDRSQYHFDTNRRKTMKRFANFKLGRSQLIGLLVVGSSLGLAYAGTVTLPNTFTAGTQASASQVNSNFTAVKSAVDTNFGLLPRIKNLGGNSSVTIAGTSLTTDPTILSTLTVTAPGDGVILAMWSAWIRCLGAEEDEIRLFVNNTATTLFNVEECTSATDDRSVAAHYVHAVTNATDYTFEMRGHDFNNAPNNISLRDSRLTLLFLPLGFDGLTATPTAANARDAGPAPVYTYTSGDSP
jgi:hypothetical protein